MDLIAWTWAPHNGPTPIVSMYCSQYYSWSNRSGFCRRIMRIKPKRYETSFMLLSKDNQPQHFRINFIASIASYVPIRVRTSVRRPWRCAGCSWSTGTRSTRASAACWRGALITFTCASCSTTSTRRTCRTSSTSRRTSARRCGRTPAARRTATRRCSARYWRTSYRIRTSTTSARTPATLRPVSCALATCCSKTSFRRESICCFCGFSRCRRMRRFWRYGSFLRFRREKWWKRRYRVESRTETNIGLLGVYSLFWNMQCFLVVTKSGT